MIEEEKAGEEHQRLIEQPGRIQVSVRGLGEVMSDEEDHQHPIALVVAHPPAPHGATAVVATTPPKQAK
jgi:hypothetical protein